MIEQQRVTPVLACFVFLVLLTGVLTAQEIPRAVLEASRNICRVHVWDDNGTGGFGCTGVLFKGKYVQTCGHLFRNAGSSLEVMFEGDSRKYSARVLIKYVPDEDDTTLGERDLAILELTGRSRPNVSGVVHSDNKEATKQVWAFGYPWYSEQVHYVTGRVVDGSSKYTKLIPDATAISGQSGGGVFNSEGELHGCILGNDLDDYGNPVGVRFASDYHVMEALKETETFQGYMFSPLRPIFPRTIFGRPRCPTGVCGVAPVPGRLVPIPGCQPQIQQCQPQPRPQPTPQPTPRPTPTPDDDNSVVEYEPPKFPDPVLTELNMQDIRDIPTLRERLEQIEKRPGIDSGRLDKLEQNDKEISSALLDEINAGNDRQDQINQLKDIVNSQPSLDAVLNDPATIGQIQDKLDPIYPMWVDESGKVIDELPNGVRLGEQMKLMLTQEVLENARSK